MQRRTFLQQVGIGGTSLLLLLPSGVSALFFSSGTVTSADALASGFVQPPDSAKPWVFWQWMNGNITTEGITLDLEAMKRMGIGGALCFNNALGIPRGPIDYASESWMEMNLHAAAECQRLGLQLMLHNGVGNSGSSSPWVTPEMSMQQLVWTEVQVRNQQNIQLQLPQPQVKAGYYRDITVWAYPSLAVEQGTMEDCLQMVLHNKKAIDFRILLDVNPDTKIRLDTGDELLLIFEKPFNASSITLTRKAEVPRNMFDVLRDHPPRLKLESSMDGQGYLELASFNAPEFREMDTPVMQNFAPSAACYFRLTCTGPTWLSSLELISGPRLAGWPAKANWTHGNSQANAAVYDESTLISAGAVQDLSTFMDTSGRLNWTAPQNGNWTILRFGHTTTGEMPAAHADAGEGLEIDKFRKAALDFHYAHFLKKVIDKLNPYVGKSFQGFTTDSWEAGNQNWSMDFPQDFAQKRGYTIGPWLLTMTGRIVESLDKTERFLWDLRRTQAELLSENYYGHLQKLCHQHGLQYHAEPYGDGNLDSLQIGQYLDVPMAEFWTRYTYGSDVTSKQVASIAHVYGKPVAAAEAFTGTPLTSKWTEYPYSLKAQADRFFTLGINRLALHVFVHQPYTTGFPGMTMGPLGTHFDRNNTWTEQAQGWLKYVQRTQFLLQQGLPVVDIAYYQGDEQVSGIPNIYRFLGKEYHGDVVGRDALFNRFSIQDGRIVLPNGMSYKSLVLPPDEAFLGSTLRRLRELVEQGMTLVVRSRPRKTLGFNADFQGVVELFGLSDGKNKREYRIGKGKVLWNYQVDSILFDQEVYSDFSYSGSYSDTAIHFTHRKLPDAEFYFISNQKRRRENLTCWMRITGFLPELWDSETGEIMPAPVYRLESMGTFLALELAPAGSCFVVFRKKTTQNGWSLVSHSKNLLLYAQDLLEFPVPNWWHGNNFSISCWAKPDTYAHDGKSMLFHAIEAERDSRLGKGHAICALGMGLNGVKVYERSSGTAQVVLNCEKAIAGWTHLALVYQNGTPRIYLNGVLAATGKLSAFEVHADVKPLPHPEQFSSFFEGNHTPLVFEPKSWTDTEIQAQFARGLPDPPLPFTLRFLAQNEAVVTENGRYKFEGENTKVIEVQDCEQVSLNQDWTLQFPTQSGAPAQVQIPQIQSLRLHPDFGVRHFSGTMTYQKTIHLAATEFRKNRHFLLDLGRVEVTAKLWVNDQQVALLWKEPFCADITTFAQEGNNTLRIEVTNLWPNRLIGDEHLPIEHTYSPHHFIEKLPEWYTQNQPNPGERRAFSVWQHYRKDDPLLESGLLGPVRLIFATRIQL